MAVPNYPSNEDLEDAIMQVSTNLIGFFRVELTEQRKQFIHYIRNEILPRLQRLEEFAVQVQEFAVTTDQRLQRLEAFAAQMQTFAVTTDQRLQRLEEFAAQMQTFATTTDQRLQRLEEFATTTDQRLQRLEQGQTALAQQMTTMVQQSERTTRIVEAIARAMNLRDI